MNGTAIAKAAAQDGLSKTDVQEAYKVASESAKAAGMNGNATTWLLVAALGKRCGWTNEKVAEITGYKPGSVSAQIGVTNKGSLIAKLREADVDTTPFEREIRRRGGGEAVALDDLLSVFDDE